MNKNEEVNFKDVAKSMGMEESAARISIALPPIDDHVIQYRAFCVGEMMLKRLIESGRLKEITQNSWGEIRRCYTSSKDKVIVLIQFNGAPQPFPLEMPIKALVGHKDAVIQTLRKVERELPLRIKAWNSVTKNGMIRYKNNQVMLELMNKNRKTAG